MQKTKVKYPIGEQSFEMLRKGGFLYVDKTLYIEEIVSGSKYYFLGRPRRFGKSLFLSTMKCFFQGKKELFKGLHIDSFDWDWEPYPVLHLDLNNQQFKNDEDLDILVESFISRSEKEYGITPISTNHSARLAELIRVMAEKTGRGVVILVDEYDKPLVNNIHNRERFVLYRDKLAALYSNFKSSADYIRLVFLTGVSRFGKLSVFSGLNNIRDISFNKRFSGICGITEKELLTYFQPGIGDLSEEFNRNASKEVETLKRWYDGYHFSEKCPDIYNPFSILQVFDNLKYENYWIASGTPTLLAEQLKRIDADLSKVLNITCGQNQLEGLDIDDISPISLLYQTGYLTIKDYDYEEQLYTLGLPNQEVRQGFLEFLLPLYTRLNSAETRIFIFELRKEINEGRIDDFMKRLQSLFAGIGYEMKFDEERNVQNALYLVFSLVGLKADTEIHTSDGRIDILVRTPGFFYIMELKYDSTPQEALEQIARKRYALPWATDNRTIIELGINYSSRTRRIENWLSRII